MLVSLAVLVGALASAARRWRRRGDRRGTDGGAGRTTSLTDISQQVAAALRTAAASGSEQTGEARLTYALGWVVANGIVAARYHDSALDALPVFHPEQGWDRFLLTRRVSCQCCAAEPADAFGLIMLDGEDPPRVAHPNGETRLALGRLLRRDPRAAMARVLDLFPPLGLMSGDHTACWHARAACYPTLYAVVADLITGHPAITAAREVFVDDGRIEGSYHPLYIHTAARAAHPAYDWIELQTPDCLAYCHIQGEQAVYLTDQGRWSTVVKPLAAEPPERMGRRILAWLRVQGEPDPNVD